MLIARNLASFSLPDPTKKEQAQIEIVPCSDLLSRISPSLFKMTIPAMAPRAAVKNVVVIGASYAGEGLAYYR